MVKIRVKGAYVGAVLGACFFATFSSPVGAAVIDACALEVGTDASTVVPGTTVSFVSVAPGATEIDLVNLRGEPVFIEATRYELPECTSKAIGPMTGDLYWGLAQFLEDRARDGSAELYFAGLATIRVDFPSPVRSISFTGSHLNDGFGFMLFDSHGNWLNYPRYGTYGTDYYYDPVPEFKLSATNTSEEFFETCGEYDVYISPCFTESHSIQVMAGPSVSFMFVGGVDVPNAYIHAISFTVPEPTTLALLGLGLVGIGYARRRKAS